MNEHNDKHMIDPVERALAELPLRKPSAELDRRIEKTLWGDQRTPADGRPVIARIGRWAGWFAGVAAMVLVAFYAGRYTTSPGDHDKGQIVAEDTENNTPQDADEDVRVVNEWSSVEPGQVIYTADQVPLQTLRRRVVRQESWVDPKTHVEYEITEPVEQIILLPVGTGVY